MLVSQRTAQLHMLGDVDRHAYAWEIRYYECIECI